MRAHGAVLIFDEVKCGGTIAYGGAAERYGVQPHLAAWAKAIGGGSTIGAFGGEPRIMDYVTKGAAQQGTFNGNPLSSATGLAALTQVLTRDAYDHLGKLGTHAGRGLRPGDRRERASRRTPWTWARRAASPTARRRSRTTGTSWRPTPSIYWASYPWMVNRGIFMTPGDEEQWTVSVQHTEDDIQTYVDAFGEFCQSSR